MIDRCMLSQVFTGISCLIGAISPSFAFELFFCKKIPLSRRVEYVMDGSMDHSVSELVSE